MITENQIRAYAKAMALQAVQLANVNEVTYLIAQTLDATPTVIAIIEIPDATSGRLTVEIEAIEDSAGGSLGVVQMVRFLKFLTLTLNTPVDVYPLETDITGATFSINVNSDENIEIEVTGFAGAVNWQVKTKLLTVNANATP